MRLIILVILFPLYSFSQGLISGKINWNNKWMRTIYISELQGVESFSSPIDSISLDEDGRFSYKLSKGISPYSIYRLLLPPARGNENSIVEGVDDNYFFLCFERGMNCQVKADADSLFYSVKILGSPASEQLLAFREQKRGFQNLALLVEVKSRHNRELADGFKKAMFPLWMDEVEKFREHIKFRLSVEKKPSMLICGLYYYHQTRFGKYDSAYYRDVIKRLDAGLPFVKNLLKKLQSIESARVGKFMPEVFLSDTSGLFHTLNEYNAQLIVVDFWASWCRPCRIANTGMIKDLNMRFKDQAQFVSVSVDGNKESWIKALNMDKCSWTQLLDQKPFVHKMLEIFIYPLYIVLDSEFRIIYETSNDFELSTYLESKLRVSKLR